MGVFVLDDAGNVKAYSREDGASMFRFDIALGKAWGAVLIRNASGAAIGPLDALGRGGGTGDESFG
jgi:uncharacterized protein GlcG (DUF336 family)